MCWKCRVSCCRIRTLRFWSCGVVAKLALHLPLDILDDAEDLSICLEDFFSSWTIQAEVSVRIFILIYFTFTCILPSKSFYSSLKHRFRGHHRSLDNASF